MKTIHDLCDIVRQTAYAIHVYHNHGIEHGLLINFGSYRFQIRKFILSQGTVKEEGLRGLVGLAPLLFVLSVFFCG